MSLYKLNDIVYCTNTTWLHERCKITEIVQNSTMAEEIVYEAQSLSSNERLLVSEDCITLTPKLNIKQLRISTRLSQAKFAHKFKIPTRTLQKWEIGQSSPPPYVISMIQQMLEIEQELNRLYYVLGKLQEKPLPPMEELAPLLRIPTDACDINPDLALIKVNTDIAAYEAALKEVKGK